MIFINQKLVWTYYQCLDYAITSHLNHSFFLTLALKTKTRVMIVLVSPSRNWTPILTKFITILIKIRVPYRLSMGSWLGIGAYIVYNLVRGKVFTYIHSTFASRVVWGTCSRSRPHEEPIRCHNYNHCLDLISIMLGLHLQSSRNQ